MINLALCAAGLLAFCPPPPAPKPPEPVVCSCPAGALGPVGPQGVAGAQGPPGVVLGRHTTSIVTQDGSPILLDGVRVDLPFDAALGDTLVLTAVVSYGTLDGFAGGAREFRSTWRRAPDGWAPVGGAGNRVAYQESESAVRSVVTSFAWTDDYLGVAVVVAGLPDVPLLWHVTVTQ